MRVFSGHGGLTAADRGGVAALGNFDGVHLGHAGLLGFARDHARRIGAPLAVITFEPHPRRYFQPDCPPFRLTTRAEKLARLEGLGVEIVCELPFNAELANRTAPGFVDEILARALGIRAVAANANFRFGKGREGSFCLLARDTRFETLEAPVVLDAQGRAVSSSRVREALAGAAPREAAALLGRPWAIPYQVETGDRRGRELGYPTANGRLGELLRPAFGIYAVRARLADGRSFDGVANIGIRPMWEASAPLVETHLFGFSGDLYGQGLVVTLVEFLRPEAKFDGLEPLLRQMALDCEQAREALRGADCVQDS